MSIRVTCTCGKRFKTKDEHAGKKAKCPNCGQTLVLKTDRPADSSKNSSANDVLSWLDDGQPPRSTSEPIEVDPGAKKLRASHHIAAASQALAEAQHHRHGCLTSWLIVMLVANAATVLAHGLVALTQQSIPGLPAWGVWLFAFCGALNVAFTIALFKWKMWGFMGFCITSVIVFVINFAYFGPTAILGVLGPVALFGVLQIGGEKKGWAQLE